MPDEFYHPDYSQTPSPSTEDYRHTLYWNPNLKLNGTETHVDFYNGSRSSTLSIHGAAIGAMGPSALSPR